MLVVLSNATTPCRACCSIEARAQLDMSIAEGAGAALCQWQCRQICAHPLPTQTQGLQLLGGRPEPGADPPAQRNNEVRPAVGKLAHELTKAWGRKMQLPVHPLPQQQNANSLGKLMGSMITAARKPRAWLRCKHASTAKEVLGRRDLHTAPGKWHRPDPKPCTTMSATRTGAGWLTARKMGRFSRVFSCARSVQLNLHPVRD